jgi:hypothetical protein
MNKALSQKDKAKEAKRLYMQSWRQKPENKKKIQDAQERYWLKKFEEIANN